MPGWQVQVLGGKLEPAPLVQHKTRGSMLIPRQQPVKKALYEIEDQLDALDKAIDKSNLDKCFDCRQESRIACCYKTVSLTG